MIRPSDIENLHDEWLRARIAADNVPCGESAWTAREARDRYMLAEQMRALGVVRDA